MKTFKLIGYTLVFLLICLNFTHCSNEEDNLNHNNSRIIYQTIDNSVIYFDNEDVFGRAIITSNTYSAEDGYGIIELSSDVISIDNSAFYNQDKLLSITLPNSVVRIKDYAFYNCINLTRLTLGDHIRSTGYCSFANCNKLSEVHINNLEAWFKIDFSDGENPLSSNKSWSSEIVSTGLYLKGELIKDLVIPDKVTHIKKNALANCISITSVTIPDSVIAIGSHAFGGCSGLTSVSIDNGVTSIKSGVFYGCSGLTSITIPESVTEIGYNAFSECSRLASIYVKASIPAKSTDEPIIGVGDIYYHLGCEDATLYVPKGSLEAYQSAEGWKEFKDIQEWDVL